MLCGCLFSIMIEVLQFLTESGFCQLDDVLTNTLGTAIGWINRNDVDFISIILDTIQNSLSQWTVISAKLVKQTRGYNSKWRRESKKFLEIHPLCVRCLEKGIATPATVVDHIIPHRGDQELFWDRSNWQPLCKKCHDRKTMTEDKEVKYSY